MSKIWSKSSARAGSTGGASSSGGKNALRSDWLLQQVQKIGHIAPTAGASRRAKAAHDPVRGSFTPELVAFSLDARHPVDEGAPHWFGDINSFRIAGRERQRFDGLEQRKWDRLL